MLTHYPWVSWVTLLPHVKLELSLLESSGSQLPCWMDFSLGKVMVGWVGGGLHTGSPPLPASDSRRWDRAGLPHTYFIMPCIVRRRSILYTLCCVSSMHHFLIKSVYLKGKLGDFFLFVQSFYWPKTKTVHWPRKHPTSEHFIFNRWALQGPLDFNR